MFISNSGSRGYQIANSLRLRSSATAYLSRTLGGSGNTQTWTWSGWVKRGALGTLQTVFGLNSASTNIFTLAFQADNTLRVLGRNASVDVLNITTTAVYRDPSAWMHIVVAIDTTQATAANRARLYVNGAEVTAFSTATYPAQNTNLAWNNSSYTHNIGREDTGSYLDGYQAEIYFVNAQQLTPSSFGQTNTDGVWTPKAYTGTYGTNGFYLKFNDGSNTTNLCLDRSGNGNNWTPNNISVTAGATYDWMVDTPTNNYAVLNGASIGADATLSNANLSIAYGSATTRNATMATFGMSSGKWYWEIKITSLGSPINGITSRSSASDIANYPGSAANGWGYWSNGTKYVEGVNSAYGSAYTTNDVVAFAFDADSGTLTCYLNNVSQGSLVSGLASGTYFPAFGDGGAAGTWSGDVNFGQRPFTYTPPTGFKALCSANLPAVTIANPKQHFDVKTRTGTGASANITGYSFAPDMVWIKSRGRALDNTLYDRLRGTQARLESNTTDAEVTTDAGLTAFNSDGYTLNTLDQVNGTTATNSFVDWAWKANGAGVTNTAGSITSTVSANTTAGFSIVTYTGNGTAGATIGHGLGVAPKLVIVKKRSATSAEQWITQHSAIGATKYLLLNGTAAAATDISAWNNTAPTSSVVTLGAGAGWGTNTSTDTYLALCWSEVPGFSKFGSYTGNGSADGPFVYCGFRPRYVMVKNAGAVADWVVFDTARDANNQSINWLRPNGSNTETASEGIDILSNGFKLRFAAGSANGAATHIFAAFAENPFGGSNIAPATAR